MLIAISIVFSSHFIANIQPIFQREALWVNLGGSKRCAIKISVGGVYPNAKINGPV